MQKSSARTLLVKTVLMLVAKVAREDVLGSGLCPARSPSSAESASVCPAAWLVCGLKSQPATSAYTVKSIMSKNTARDDAAAATKPPSVGPTMILTFENMAMAELMSLSSTGSSVRYAG